MRGCATTFLATAALRQGGSVAQHRIFLHRFGGMMNAAQARAPIQSGSVWLQLAATRLRRPGAQRRKPLETETPSNLRDWWGGSFLPSHAAHVGPSPRPSPATMLRAEVSPTPTRRTVTISIPAHFDPATYERGVAYARAGFVTSVAFEGAGELTASVRNNAGKVYRQRITLTAAGPGLPVDHVHGICTCPVGVNCKHVAAILCALATRQSGGLATAAPQSAPAPRLPVEVTAWLRRVEGLTARPAVTPPTPAVAPRPEDYPSRIRDRLLYVLDTSQPELRIDAIKGSLAAKGGGLNRKMRRFDVLGALRGTNEPAGFFRPVDLVLIGRLARCRALVGQTNYSYDRLPEILQTPGEMGAELIAAMAATGRLMAEPGNPDSTLAWSDDCFPARLGWSMTHDGHQRPTFIAPQGEPVQLVRFGADGLWIDRVGGRIGKLSDQPTEEILRLIALAPTLAPADLSIARDLLPRSIGTLPLPTPKTAGAVERAARNRTVHMTLGAASAHPRHGRRYGSQPLTLPALRLRFSYEGHLVDFLDLEPPRFVEKGDLVTLIRDHDWEDACMDRLIAAGAIPVEELDIHAPTDGLMAYDLTFADGEVLAMRSGESRRSDALAFMARIVPDLLAEGWQIEVKPAWPYQIEASQTQLVVETHKAQGERFAGHGWFDIGFAVEISGRRHDLAPLVAAFLDQIGDELPPGEVPALADLQALLARRPVYLDLGRNRYAAVSLEPIAGVLHLFLTHHAQAGKMHPAEAMVVAQAAEALEGSTVRFADHAGILPLARSLRLLSGEHEIMPPQGLAATLRPYQAFGAAWMGSLIEAGFGGVLADDMGLGKTLQVLALLQARREQGAAKAPALLVVPTSLLHGWQEQAARFTPELRLLILHGGGRKERLEQVPMADLVITTYPLLARDHDSLVQTRWDLVILDEAQVLKNPASQAAKALRDIPTAGRLALTGTPMENSLQDLWTLFDWVVPGLLGDRKTFQVAFRTPIEKQGDRTAQARLNRRIRLFLLRRTKDAVAADLPPRTEILERIDLQKPQQALYETVRSAMDQRVRDAVAARGLAAARITILDALLKLRQVCCDPSLVKTEAARAVTDSAKRARLRELLVELVAERRRVLVFSQFVEMLDLISQDLSSEGIAFEVLTGQTRNRGEVIERFRAGTAPVFLISLKAGGVGLTLTEADTVIIYDPWWNPAVERQAMDRAHRIGQDKPVFVHRLVTVGTVEQRILALQEKKQALADALLGDGADDPAGGLLDDAVLRDLFAPL
jgi:superfamily II DNA or RNA helicase